MKTNPIQTQSNPISERVKLMQSVYSQRIMKKNAAKGYEKTKPKQTQFLQRPKMNANLFTKKDYENFIPLAGQKNKPNQSQSFAPLFRVIYTLRGGFQIPSINGQDRLVICSGKYSLDFPFFAGKQADVIIFPENGQNSFTALFA